MPCLTNDCTRTFYCFLNFLLPYLLCLFFRFIAFLLLFFIAVCFYILFYYIYMPYRLLFSCNGASQPKNFTGAYLFNRSDNKHLESWRIYRSMVMLACVCHRRGGHNINWQLSVMYTVRLQISQLNMRRIPKLWAWICCCYSTLSPLKAFCRIFGSWLWGFAPIHYWGLTTDVGR